MILDILEQKLHDASLGVIGETIFRNTMPAENKVGIMTREPLEGIKVNPHIEGYYKPRLQVIVRHTDPVDGRELANRVIKALVVEGREKHEATEEHGPCHIDLFYPENEPLMYPRLDGNTLEWSINFKTAFGIKPSWKL